jgi:dethiobiotin synthetase
MILFVGGTDTGVGKTLVTALLARVLSDHGMEVKVQKWVSTGNGNTSEDCIFIYKLLRNEIDKKTHEKNDLIDVSPDIAPYCLPLAASPHLAAEQAGINIDAKVIKDALFRLKSSCEILIVEGIGGLLVPLNRNLILADLISDLNLPTLIVARSGIGTLNHTLLTLEAMRQRKIPIVGILLNSDGKDDSLIARDNYRTIAKIGKTEVFGVIPRVESPLDALSYMRPIGERIVNILKKIQYTRKSCLKT